MLDPVDVVESALVCRGPMPGRPADLGDRSMFRRTSAWRFDRSYRPIELNWSGGLAFRGPDVKVVSIGSGRLPLRGVLASRPANSSMASLAYLASSFAKVIRRDFFGLGWDVSCPVAPTATSIVAIAHHWAYSFSSLFQARIVSLDTLCCNVVRCSNSVLRAVKHQ